MARGYLDAVKILMVDDNPFTCRLVRQVLTVFGARDVTISHDAQEAYKIIGDKMPDLAIVNWQMKPVTGLDLVKRLRKDEKSPNPFLPIIMMTAFADPKHVFTARDAGVNEYVIKPVSAKALYGRIQAVIEKPRRFVRVGEFFGPDRRRHGDIFPGADRRGAEGEEKKVAAQGPVADMKQDEVDRLFNPDEVANGNGAPNDAKNGEKPDAKPAEK